MKSLNSLLNSRKKASYLKLKTRFVKNLKSGQIDQGRTTYYWVERLKKFERQLGIRSTLKLRHWALAAALGIITTAATMKSKARGSYNYESSFHFRKNDFTELVEASNEMAMVVAPGDTSFVAGPHLGDGIIQGTGREVADFDGDGDLDFIAFNYYKDHTLYLNNGSGVFDSKVPVTQDPSVEFSAADTVDFDGDGDVDILVLENYYTGTGSRIQFFENDGTGAFNGDSTIIADASYQIKSVQAGDIDGDGDIDILLATHYYYAGSYYAYELLINNGSGNPWTTQGLSGTQFPYFYSTQHSRMWLSDANVDGELDIIAMPRNNNDVNYAGGYYEGFRVFLNDGFGNLNTGNSITSTFGVYPTSTFDWDREQIADVDADGDPDVVFMVYQYPNPEQIVVALNDGTGSFTISQSRDFGQNDYLDEFSVGNFDADGDLEIVVSYEYNYQVRYTEIFDFDNAADTFSISIAILDGNVKAFDDVSVGDFDNDGDDDVIGFNEFDIEQFQNNSGTFDKISQGFTGPVWANNFKLVDVDGDGDLDIVGDVLGQFLTNDGLGNFTLVQTLADSVGSILEEFAVGDFDNDGDQDLVFSEDVLSGSTIYRYLRPFEFAGGQFSSLPKVALDTGYSYLDNLKFLELGNLDSDPELELVTMNTESCCDKYVVVHDFVAGNFDPLPLAFFRPNPEPEGIKIIDFDQNGIDDLLTAPRFGDLDFLKNNGTGTVFTKTDSLTRFGDNVISIDTADLDGDGDLDLLVVYDDPYFSGYSGHRIFYNGYSDSTALVSSSIGLTFLNYQDINTGRFIDIDADGDKDIVFANYDNGDVVFLNKGGQVFEERPFLNSYTSYNIAVGDVDGDGDEDILSSQYESGISQVLFNEIFVAPEFSDQSFSVDETAGNGSIVGALVASAPPGSPNALIYTIQSGNEAGIFGLDPDTGELSVVDSTQLDYEMTISYDLIVEVTDTQVPVIATVTVDINDVDEAPTFADATFSLNENEAPGTVIGTVSGVDPEGLGVTYAITNGNASGAFALDGGTGELTILDSTQFDFETNPQFILDIEATDGTNPAVAQVTVDVVDVDEAPTFADATFSLNENEAPGTVIGTVAGVDPEGLGVTYSIANGNASGAFALDGATGELTVLDSTQFDFETTPQFILDVEATDGTNPTSAQVTVDVSDVDEAPLVSDATFSVIENSPAGAIVGLVTATDPEGLGITYSIVSGDIGVFSIDAAGTITVLDSAAIDFEVTQQFNLGVEASDGVNNPVANVTIDVQDIVETTIPVVTEETFIISENPTNGTVVGTVTITDPLAPRPLTYSIISGDPDGVFTIDGTASILVADSSFIDFESITQFSLEVEATSGIDTGTGFITVDVTDVNETPTVQTRIYRVDQDTETIDPSFGTITATDPENDILIYSIESITPNDAGAAAFGINSSTGALSIATQGVLDYDTTPNYDVVVSVSDGEFAPTATQQIRITTLARDQQALLDLYDATGGQNWSESTGFTVSEPLATNQWFGVTVTDGRVTLLELPDNNLVGEVPASFTDLTGLKEIDFSGNQITGIPDVSEFDSLTLLDVSSNKLGIQDLLDNADGTYEFIFSNQVFGEVQADPDTIDAGTDFSLTYTELDGYNATYEWYFESLYPENSPLSLVGSSDSYTITSMDYNKMGTYYLEVSQIAGLEELETGFTLTTSPKTILAQTDLFGTVVLPDATNPLTSGDVIIYEITDEQYNAIDTSSVDGVTGAYEIQDIVLGDYILLVQNDVVAFDEVLQTYYISTNDWVEADTLFLRQESFGLDITMLEKPIPTDVGDAQLVGLVETNFADDEGSRILARRKVKKAGCSLRRRTRSGGGRGQQFEDYELFAYVESDDNGNFTFEEIPPGEYLINIQYPGVPMDTTSTIKFTVSEDREGQVFDLKATITEDGISVDIEEILGLNKPYLKDIQLYPNPTDGKLAVEFLIYRAVKDLKMKVIDLNGMLISEQELIPRLGPQRVEVNLSGVQSGVYFLVLTDEAESFNYLIKVSKK